MEIDGEHYWDGGIVSNSPLNYVWDEKPLTTALIVMVDLFNAKGELPRNLDEVAERQKDVTYASKQRFTSERMKELGELRQALTDLLAKLPANLKNGSEARKLAALCDNRQWLIARLTNPRLEHGSQSKDYEFSRATVLDHWAAGLEDVRYAIANRQALEPTGLVPGVRFYDLPHSTPHATTGAHPIMNENEVRERAFAMPLTSPAYPPGPYRFVNREFFIVAYRTDPDALKAVIPAPLEFTEARREVRIHPHARLDRVWRLHRKRPGHPGQFPRREGRLRPLDVPGLRPAHCRRARAVGLSEEAGFAGAQGRKGHPAAACLRFGSVPVAVATMGYKHQAMDNDKARASVEAPGFLLKIIPHVDGTPRICEIVRYRCGDVTVHGAWSGPAALELFHHALAPVAALPVLEVLSATHILCDLTLNLGTVVHDYLAPTGANHEVEGQSRHRHRRGQRHRQGHRPALRARGRQGCDRRPEQGSG